MKLFHSSSALLSALLLTAGLNSFPQAAIAQIAASLSSSKATPAHMDSLKGLIYHGYEALAKGDFTEAEKIFSEGRDKALALHDKPQAILFFDGLGTLYSNQGQLDKAGEQYTYALNLAKAGTDMEVTARQYEEVAAIRTQQGRKEYLTNLQQAAACWDKTDNKPATAACHDRLAVAYICQQQPAEAATEFERSLSLYEAIGDKWKLAQCCLSLGGVCVRTDQPSEGLINLQRALRLYQELGDKLGIANSNLELGNVYYKQKQFDKAIGSYQASLKAYQESGENSLAGIYTSIGKTYQQLKETDKAEKAFAQAKSPG